MLVGKYFHQIDEKGRIRIPAKLKDLLPGKLFIIKGAGRRLLVYTQSDAAAVLSKLKNDKLATSEISDVRLQLLSSAIIVDYDSQGRTQLNDELIRYAGIDKNIVTIGNLDRLEIWSEENWNQKQAAIDTDFDTALKNAAEFLE